jgi:hypothetical protein
MELNNSIFIDGFFKNVLKVNKKTYYAGVVEYDTFQSMMKEEGLTFLNFIKIHKEFNIKKYSKEVTIYPKIDFENFKNENIFNEEEIEIIKIAFDKMIEKYLFKTSFDLNGFKATVVSFKENNICLLVDDEYYLLNLDTKKSSYFGNMFEATNKLDGLNWFMINGEKNAADD